MRVLGLLLGVLACAAGCGEEEGGLDAGEPAVDGSTTSGDLLPIADPGQPAPPPPPLPSDAIAAASADLTASLARAGYTRSVRIEDLDTGQILFEDGNATLLAPASNTKLYTTAAALEILGPDDPLTTRVVGTAAIDGAGLLAGDLYVIFEHDFGASPLLYASPSDPVDRLALELKARGLSSVSGAVYVGGEPIYGGSSLGTLDVAAERSAMVGPLDAALTAAGIAHAGPLTSAAVDPPAGAIPILVRGPLPLAVGVSPLNVESHNEFADLLQRHVGWRIEGTSSAAAGKQAIADWLASTSVPTAGLVFEDGSGLSHNNRTSADATMALMKFMEAQPVGRVWRRSLAIAGIRGTLQNRLMEADTLGRVFAKTGTLSDAIALSGFLEHAHDGQRYAFAMMLNAVADQTLARAMLDDAVRAIAKDRRGLPVRLAAPRLRWARGLRAAGFAELAWQPVAGASGYVVWRSDDGARWPRSEARRFDGPTVILGGLTSTSPTFLRVTALDAQGLESDPSVVYAVSAGADANALLLVDGNDRWQAEPQPENTLGGHHDFLVALAQAAGARSLASCDDDEVGGAVALAPYPAVVWAAGEESEAQGALTEPQQAALSAYLAGEGRLVLSGSELVWNLDQRGDMMDKAFLVGVLQASYVADSADTYELAGTPGGPLAGVQPASFLAPDGMNVRYADVLSPAGTAIALLHYVSGAGGDAMVGVAGKVVVCGFPIEAVVSLPQRRAIVEGALLFLGR